MALLGPFYGSIEAPKGCYNAQDSGQERQKRKLGDTDEDDEAPTESLSCKRRNLELAREKELLDESMDLEPTV